MWYIEDKGSATCDHASFKTQGTYDNKIAASEYGSDLLVHICEGDRYSGRMFGADVQGDISLKPVCQYPGRTKSNSIPAAPLFPGTFRFPSACSFSPWKMTRDFTNLRETVFSALYMVFCVWRNTKHQTPNTKQKHT